MTRLILREMAKTVVLEIEDDLKVFGMSSLDLDIVTLEFNLGLTSQKEEIIVDSNYSFTPRPIITIQLNKNI